MNFENERNLNIEKRKRSANAAKFEILQGNIFYSRKTQTSNEEEMGIPDENEFVLRESAKIGHNLKTRESFIYCRKKYDFIETTITRKHTARTEFLLCVLCLDLQTNSLFIYELVLSQIYFMGQYFCFLKIIH